MAEINNFFRCPVLFEKTIKKNEMNWKKKTKYMLKGLSVVNSLNSKLLCGIQR